MRQIDDYSLDKTIREYCPDASVIKKELDLKYVSDESDEIYKYLCDAIMGLSQMYYSYRGEFI